MSEKKTTAYTDAISIKENVPGLLPFIPVLYVAWSDCVLAPTEISTIRQQIDGSTWLTEDEQHTLAVWLDPAAPPNLPGVFRLSEPSDNAGQGACTTHHAERISNGLKNHPG